MKVERGSGKRADPEAFAQRALEFRELVADASSLIVLDDALLLSAVLARWRLSTTLAVAGELGGSKAKISCTGIRIVDGPESRFSGSDGRPLATDAALVAFALRADLPLLSEDGRMLRKAEESSIDCLDSLVVLELLAATGAIGWEEAKDCRRLLRLRSAVSPRRAGWAEAVGLAAAKFA